MSIKQQLRDIVKPNNNDVLCGRGGGTNVHPGNLQWRALVAANKELYVTLPKRQKLLLTRSIVNAVRSVNGRFLKQDKATNLWEDVGDARAGEKTSQALREGAPDLRSKLKVEKGQLSDRGNGDAMASASFSMPPQLAAMGYPSSSLAPNIGTGHSYVMPNASTALIANTIDTYAYHYRLDVATPDQSQGQNPSLIQTKSPNEKDCPHKNDNTMPPQPRRTVPNTTPLVNGAGREEQVAGTTTLEVNGEALEPIPLTDDSCDLDKTVLQGVERYSFRGSGKSDSMGAGHRTSNADSEQLETVASARERKLRSLAPHLPPQLGPKQQNYSPPPPRPAQYCSPTEIPKNAVLQPHPIFQQRRCDGPVEQEPASIHPDPQVHFEEDQKMPARRISPGSRNGANRSSPPLPVDGGLEESVGVSFGSIMSTGDNSLAHSVGSNLSPPDHPKMEVRGANSFGSIMSFSVRGGVDEHHGDSDVEEDTAIDHDNNHHASSGIGMVFPTGDRLEDIGTSFGSMSIATEIHHGDIKDGPPVAAYPLEVPIAAAAPKTTAAQPTLFKQQKSRGSLLECSDTESEDEMKESMHATRTASSWEMLQAAVSAQQQSIRRDGDYGALHLRRQQVQRTTN